MSGTQQPGGQRWAPFPVQDWSTLPFDPYAPQDHGTLVDPSWAPPRARRSGWWPLLVITVVVALLGAGLWAADTRGASTTAATRFLPADGAARYQTRETRRPTGTEHQATVTESARLPGSAAYLSLDQALSRQVLSAMGGNSPAGHAFWRTTTTDAESTTASQQTTSVFLVDDAVELLTVSGPGIARTFTPGLIELPADVAEGARWNGNGRAGELTYRSTFSAVRAAEAAAGCLSVTGTIEFLTAAEQSAGTQGQTTTWCPGAGIVARSVTLPNLTIVDRPADLPQTPPNLRLEAATPDWSTPTTWQPRQATAMSIDPNFGEGPLSGGPGTAPPVLAASGLLIRPSSADDLVALTPKTRDAWTSVWRMHPGGRILSLAAFGDVIVVTTSLRRVIGYRDTGVRLWSRDLSDIAFHAPVRTSRSEAAVVDASGSLSVFDLVTGVVRWQRPVGAEVVVAPIAGAATVVIIDGSDTVHAYEARDGSLRWSTELEAAGGIVLGDQVVLHNSSTLMALSLADGRYRWMVPALGTLLDLAVLGDDLVLATRLGTTMISSTGRVLARRPSYLRLTTARGMIIGWGATQADVLDEQLAVITSWDTPDQTNASGAIAVVTDRYGVWRFGQDWTMIGWAGSP